MTALHISCNVAACAACGVEQGGSQVFTMMRRIMLSVALPQMKLGNKHDIITSPVEPTLGYNEAYSMQCQVPTILPQWYKHLCDSNIARRRCEEKCACAQGIHGRLSRLVYDSRHNSDREAVVEAALLAFQMLLPATLNTDAR